MAMKPANSPAIELAVGAPIVLGAIYATYVDYMAVAWVISGLLLAAAIALASMAVGVLVCRGFGKVSDWRMARAKAVEKALGGKNICASHDCDSEYFECLKCRLKQRVQDDGN